jgi:hypothetical protein
MRHLAITLVTAAAVVGAFLALRAVRTASMEAPDGPAEVRAESSPAPKSESRTAAAPYPGGVAITGVSEMEALHRAHGKVGDAMRDFLAATRGDDWNVVDREKMQHLMHALRYSTREEDIPYLLDLFERTPGASFRWWFSWAVWQIAQEMGDRFPGDRFVEPMTEVYRIDKARGYDALATITRPSAMDRIEKLLDAETEPAMRTHAIAAYARGEWDRKEDFLTRLAKDAERPGPDRVAALTAIARVSTGEDALRMFEEIALGPPQPVKGLTGNDAASHAIADVRSAAVLGVMLRGDQETARRLMDAADRAGIDSDLAKMVDQHLGGYTGPDLSEVIYDRAQRRRYVSPGEISHLIRDLDRVDRARLRELLPFIQDEETKRLVGRVVAR